MKPTKVAGTRTHLRREDGRWVGIITDVEHVVPGRKGQFPKDILDHCKDCPKIYCSGWTIEVLEYFTIWHCEKYTIQKKINGATFYDERT